MSSETETSSNTTSSYNLSYNSTPPVQNTNERETETTAQLLKKLTPQYTNRLFIKIWRANDITDIANGLIVEYKNNRDKFLCSIIQLFIDISGYQNVDLELYLQDGDLKDFIRFLENSDNPAVHKTGKYLLKMQQHKAKRKKIEEFIEIFVLLCGKEKILYDGGIIEVFTFIENMSHSILRPIKHTGVFLALKIQTGIIRTSYMIGQKIEKYRDLLENLVDTEEKTISIHKTQKYLNANESLNKITEFIHINIFQANWSHGDSQLYFMRNDCISEVAQWIYIFPGRFLRNNSLDFLIKSVEDRHHSVRLNAISLLSDIFEQYHLQIEKNKFRKTILQIHKRIFDINMYVSIKAVETLTLINSFSKLPHVIRDDLCKLIYCKLYPIAMAASKFMIQRMKTYLEECNEATDCIRMLVFFEIKANKTGLINKYPFLIETLIDEFKQLVDIPSYISILENVSIDEDSLKVLVNILTESVYQVYTGKCSMPREKQKSRKIDPKIAATVTKDLVTNLSKLPDLVKPIELLTPLLTLVHKYGMKYLK